MTAKTKITVTLRTFNEERNVRDCLESVSWADEIVVVDAESTDRTVGIAREFTERIIVRPWAGHIAASQFITDQARNLWVLSMDADERVSSELRDEILALDLDRRGGRGSACARSPAPSVRPLPGGARRDRP